MLHQANSTAKRSKPSYFYAILSVTLVLFLLGLILILFVNTQKVSTYLKENIAITFVLKDDVKQVEIDALHRQIDKQTFVKRSEFVSKEEAAKDFQTEYGENFMDILGGKNPLFSSINVYLKEDYANKDSLKILEQRWTGKKTVQEVYYQKNVLESINENVNKLSIALIILSLIFFIVALVLIDNTMKLAMFSNRFLIKSMQLVGATRWFITKPFISQSIFNGVLSGVLASVLLVGVLYFINSSFPYLKLMEDARTYGILCLVIVMIGAAISWFSTRQAVLKYLKTKLDDLY